MRKNFYFLFLKNDLKRQKIGLIKSPIYTQTSEVIIPKKIHVYPKAGEHINQLNISDLGKNK